MLAQAFNLEVWDAEFCGEDGEDHLISEIKLRIRNLLGLHEVLWKRRSRHTIVDRLRIILKTAGRSDAPDAKVWRAISSIKDDWTMLQWLKNSVGMIE